MRFLIGFVSLLLLSFPALADSLTIENAWARASAGSTSAAYGTFTNHTDKDVKLVSARAPVAKTAEFHTNDIDENGVMRMKHMEFLRIPAHSSITCEPGGLHIMLMELEAPLEKGKEFPLFLRTAEGEKIKTTVIIR